MDELYKKEIDLLYRLRKRGLIPQEPTMFTHPKVKELADKLLELEYQMHLVDEEIFREYYQ